MSTMFELLKQPEPEREATLDAPAQARPDRSLVKGVVFTESGDYFNDEISRLVQTIFLSGNGRAPRRIVFCGVDDARGSTTVCASAARALSARSEPVCLVDARVRGPRLAECLGLEDKVPSAEEELPVRDRCVQLEHHLWLAGSDMLRDETDALVSVTELKLQLGKLQSVYGTVIIDAPGTSTSRDAILLGQLADAVVLVVEANKTRRIAARKAKEFLEHAGVHLIGTILNNRTFPIPEALYRRL